MTPSRDVGGDAKRLCSVRLGWVRRRGREQRDEGSGEVAVAGLVGDEHRLGICGGTEDGSGGEEVVTP